MQGLFRAVRSCQEMAEVAVLRHSLGGDPAEMRKLFARLGCVTSMHQYKGLENTTVADVLRAKEGQQVGPWLWCRSDDIVHDAAKKMAENNVGSLVVLKPGDKQLIAGIFTERGAHQDP
uniref:CBS domain-containing protein n=1 Tax=Opuntia streptacantha TaxID=393608 RepID=A0A7C9CIH3_OPUST